MFVNSENYNAILHNYLQFMKLNTSGLIKNVGLRSATPFLVNINTLGVKVLKLLPSWTSAVINFN